MTLFQRWCDFWNEPITRGGLIGAMVVFVAAVAMEIMIFG